MSTINISCAIRALKQGCNFLLNIYISLHFRKEIFCIIEMINYGLMQKIPSFSRWQALFVVKLLCNLDCQLSLSGSWKENLVTVLSYFYSGFSPISSPCGANFITNFKSYKIRRNPVFFPWSANFLFYLLYFLKNFLLTYEQLFYDSICLFVCL